MRRRRLTYLGPRQLRELYAAAAAAEEESRAGVFVEAGCALGGSAIVLARAKNPARPLLVYDVFGMIPAPSAQDGDDVRARYEQIRSGESRGLKGDVYYGYQPDLLDKVRSAFEVCGVPVDDNAVTLVQGLFQDTIVGDEAVALAHIDGDWYDSVRTCIERIGPRLSPGGVMVIDDYFAWSGCRTAVDEFLASHEAEYRVVKRSRLHIVRV